MQLDLVPLWAAILAFGVFMYVLLDGFDLGVGILFPLGPSDRSRDLMMASVAPICDGNETWLVLGGLALLAAFPLAFAIIIPAVYFPILFMLLGLIFRGVAFEFRHMSKHHARWDRSFFGGSVVATFAQGVVLGTFVQGIPISGRAYAGGWFAWPNLLWLSPVPLVTLGLFVWLWRSLVARRDVAPFLAAISLFVMCYVGLGISIWPMVVPYTVSLWAAASATKAQGFLLIGTVFLLPIIVMYTGWSYWVFRGKVKADSGYHAVASSTAAAPHRGR